MKNLKIEYVDGQLVTVDVEGVSLLNAGLTGLSFEHFLNKGPHLKFEVGGEPVVEQPQPQSQPSIPAQNDELQPVEAAPAPSAQRTRNKNRNRNRSH